MVSRSRALVLTGAIGLFSTIAYAAQIALPQNDYQYYGCLQPANFNQIFFASNVPTAAGSSVDCQDYCYGLNAAFAAIGNDIGQTCYCSASRPAGVTTAPEIRYHEHLVNHSHHFHFVIYQFNIVHYQQFYGVHDD
ncbi:hypothetical protein CPLU01_08699 [Colletotrichum plurivorum]|uniref:WSC domain-containing protein n=1 Tax=Colletotrichum plurivorum TaxID=2175906 RepID=A0A8H6KAH3_9PEZI|nr:hypothetical protein CPLU01_08699 [Colletotrichum plurivorum]